MKTTYAGIDYGRGITNMDLSTGIRNGVIPVNLVFEVWTEKSEPYFGAEYRSGEEDSRDDYVEPFSFFIENEEYSAEQGSDSSDIFIVKSPFFTYAQFCSPCAPGACYLPNPLEEPVENNRAYCFGPDWPDEGQAPYPIYSVATGELV